MATDDKPRRPVRDDAGPQVRRTSSRARADGAAQPAPPRPPVHPRRPATPAAPVVPPTFTPEGAARPARPRAGDEPIVVGRPPAARRPPAPGGTAPRAVPGSTDAAPTAARRPTAGPSGPREASAAGAGTRPPQVRPQRVTPGGTPPRTPTTAPPTTPATGAPRRVGRRVALVMALLLALVLAWPVGLAVWANGRIDHVEALSGAENTPGTTYLLAGSDSREGGGIPEDGTLGARTDTIMLLHVPESGPNALISLPRDTYSEIPGYGADKLNASFAWGGPALLVQTVEGLSGLTVDHYVEVGFTGVEGVVTAVDGVELCLDRDVNEPLSGLVWTAGCHVADGPTALAFARMRYDDPEGDIGRAKRQQQLISALTGKVTDSSLLTSPGRQVSLVRAGTDALTVSEGSGIVDLGQLALAFRRATGPEGITGTPPIGDPDYRPGGVGSTVLLDTEQAPAFWTGIRDGSLPAGPVGGLPQPG